MVNKRLNFTKKVLDAIPAADPGKRRYLYDSHTRGLAIGVTDRGIKTFILYRRVQGKPERMFLGRYPDMTIEKARGKAADHASLISQGENPADKRRLDRAEMTLQEFFNEYLTRHAKVRKRTWKEDQSKFKQYLASSKDGINLAVRKLSTLTKADLAALHSKIGKTHKITANRVLALSSSIFGRAIEWGLWHGSNPASGIRRYKENSRDRFLQADELPRFFKALSTEPNATIRDFFLIALLTGARRSNVLAMRWDDIELTEKRNEWRIPAASMKAGEAHVIPLVPMAVEILKQRKRESEENQKEDEKESEYVFPSEGKYGHLVEPKRGWTRLLEKAELKDIRPHDLRRTLGSWQASTGASLAIIGKTLAHKNVSTTQIYARLNLDPVRESVNTATNAMLVAAGLVKKARVVRMRKKAAR